MGAKKEYTIKEKKWLEGLQDEDKNTVLKTINDIQEKGNSKLIKPLIELAKNRDENDIQEAIQKVLFSLKVSAAHPIILEELKNIGPIPFRRILLSTLWESNIDALSHLDTLVKIAIEGDLYEAIEVLTVLEESEGELIEEKVLESLLLLKEYEANQDGIDKDKASFIQSISDKINAWNKEI